MKSFHVHLFSRLSSRIDVAFVILARRLISDLAETLSGLAEADDGAERMDHATGC